MPGPGEAASHAGQVEAMEDDVLPPPRIFCELLGELLFKRDFRVCALERETPVARGREGQDGGHRAGAGKGGRSWSQVGIEPTTKR